MNTKIKMWTHKGRPNLIRTIELWSICYEYLDTTGRLITEVDNTTTKAPTDTMHI